MFFYNKNNFAIIILLILLIGGCSKAPPTLIRANEFELMLPSNFEQMEKHPQLEKSGLYRITFREKRENLVVKLLGWLMLTSKFRRDGFMIFRYIKIPSALQRQISSYDLCKEINKLNILDGITLVPARIKLMGNNNYCYYEATTDKKEEDLLDKINVLSTIYTTKNERRTEILLTSFDNYIVMFTFNYDPDKTYHPDEFYAMVKSLQRKR